jgi:penicillin amidase
VNPVEAQASVAATIYEVWIIKLIKRFIATIESLGLRPYAPGNALVWLLSQEPFTGVGASGVDFFPEPAELAAAADRRDAVLLEVLRDVLDALPGPAYAAAFGNSTDQDAYQWGKLHRVVFPHPLGGPSSIPPAAGFEDLDAQLPGLARDGTWESVNVAPGPGLPDGANEWVNSTGPSAAFRHVHAPLRPSESGAGMLGFAVVAGGASGDPESPGYASQLGLWLTADYHPVLMTARDVRAAAQRVELFEPPTP